jgi:hypothetical protein
MRRRRRRREITPTTLRDTADSLSRGRKDDFTRRRREGEDEEELFNHYKNDLKRRAHTPSGVAGTDQKS